MATELAEPLLPKGSMRNMASIFMGKTMLEEKEPFELKTGETKPFLTLDQQVALLKSRGLIISNEENAKDILRRTNYYRLSGYALSIKTGNKFHDGESFDHLYELYRFDDAFRKIILSYSLNVEIAFRSYIAYEHSKKYGPLGYMDENNFDNAYRHQIFMEKLTSDVARSDDLFVHHHKKDRGGVFPIWVVIECSSFGEVSKMFKNLRTDDRMLISKQNYNVSREYVENWLQAIVLGRNIAAHGGRFYNRLLKSVPIKLPAKLKPFISPDSVFALVYAIHTLQPTKALADRMIADLLDLMTRYPGADKEQLGFPEDWVKILRKYETKYEFHYQG